MEPIRNVFITLEQFEEIQSKYDGICEYLNGEILFSSRTSRQHNRVVRKILTKLDIYLDGSKCEPFAEQIEVIFKNESEQYNFLPDVFVMCEDAKTSGESFISTPKIIFEVVSEKYSDNDYFIKARIYQKFGVLEYNIVEPSGSITQYRLINGHYGTPKVFEGNDVYTSVVFNDLKINLKDIFYLNTSRVEPFIGSTLEVLIKVGKLFSNFRGEFKFSKMNFFEKTIIKIIAKKDKSLGKVDGKTDISKINEENIKVFAKSLYV